MRCIDVRVSIAWSRIRLAGSGLCVLLKICSLLVNQISHTAEVSRKSRAVAFGTKLFEIAQQGDCNQNESQLEIAGEGFSYESNKALNYQRGR